MSKPSIKVGDIFKSNAGDFATVVGYLNSQKVTVEFEKDGYKMVVAARDLREGAFKNPYTPSFYGVGFIGKGNFTGSITNKYYNVYKVWVSMIGRCYSVKRHLHDPSYKDCVVCEEWHNFQVFAEWCVNHNFYGLGYELDKDLLLKGNKIYSPKTCCMLPKTINAALTHIKSNKGDYPIGVFKRTGSNKFRSMSPTMNGRVHLGTFNTPEEAFYAYKEAKEKYIKEVANKYKDQIDSRAYEALMKYEVNIDD